MKRLVYQVAVGKRSQLYETCIASVSQYCAAQEYEHIVQREAILRVRPNPRTTGRSQEAVERLGYLPIFEKENALGYLDRYDQVAVVDADVYVTEGSECIFSQVDQSADFAGVVERSMPTTEAYRRKLRSYSLGQYKSLADVDWNWNEDGAEFMNMGVMVMNHSLRRFLAKQTPREFLGREEFREFVDGVGNWKWSTDQTLLNYWLRKCDARVEHLHWHWNALFSAIVPTKIREARFIHFFLKDHLPECGQDVVGLLRSIGIKTVE